VVVALVFVGLPFVVRTGRVLHDLEPELEEAAASLGAGRLATIPARDPPSAPAADHRMHPGFRAGAGGTARSSSSPATCEKSEITPLLIMVSSSSSTTQAPRRMPWSSAGVVLLLANLMSRRASCAAEREVRPWAPPHRAALVARCW
jgi:hypothetical protein